MLGGRLPPVGVYPDRLRASSSHGAANLSISAPISKGCCRREVPENADARRWVGRRHGL